ncbi:hypothetical protein EEL32_20575 [Brevibacillus laterosporus]|uniref:Uncharacterized protein n=1 Tax=Brevibacillus laterosporus TaxID=1465 RepID=A0A502I5I9_BRELA|nr:hypothetical protein [Brevibacillus laterosporus]QDX94033.1 hypothetical protein EEL30_18090 [Brevibacillus laterosporus]TPG67991.1 hypothetical protein EEL31_05065 [Brevibacillus laterosporus]TPG81294.1 hypothetical protein EEL32_20575 [Brevibacillus laterosporus]
MRSFFGTTNAMSPTSQDFVWVSEYYDGTHLAEFDFETKEENSFYDIKVDQLNRFGIVGNGSKIFFESNGLFNVKGKGYSLSYVVDGVEYQLTGDLEKINDIITFKDAEATGNLLGGGKITTSIEQFSVGYAVVKTVDDVTFTLRVLVKVPNNGQMYFNIAMMANKNLHGKLVLMRANDRKEFEIDAPLKKGIMGEINHLITH